MIRDRRGVAYNEVCDSCYDRIGPSSQEYELNMRDYYENQECPDCGNPIAAETDWGDECANCGHVFAEDEE